MTEYTDRGEQPDYGKVLGFDHVHWWVSNAKLASDWFCARFGFEHVAYRGLETGYRKSSTHVIQQGRIRFAFSSPLMPKETEELGQDMGEHIAVHGDGVKDVAFQVENARAMFDSAVARGGEVVRPITEEEDDNGKIIFGTIKTYGDTVHTFVQRDGYEGPFWPGFVAHKGSEGDPSSGLTEAVGLEFVDHVVGNMEDKGMMPVVEYYEKILQFSKFWSVDDTQIHTEYSSLRSTVMTDFDRKVKMPINEPAKGKRKSQIQEFCDHYGGAGVQHIALNTKDIITAVRRLKARGVEFLTIPPSYYELLADRLAEAKVEVKEDMAVIRELNILVDFDPSKGYLLQLFTKPLMDKPTVFIEIIQRAGNEGFGAGNFKSLFESIEREQAKRGNLVEEGAEEGEAAGGGGGEAE